MHPYSTDQPDRWKRLVQLGGIAAAVVLLFDVVVRTTLESQLGIGWVPSFAAASYAVYWLFSNVLWDHPLLRKWGIVEVPNLQGTWEGHLRTSYDVEDESKIADIDDPEDDLTAMETEIYIEQTWDKIVVELDGPNPTRRATGRRSMLTMALSQHSAILMRTTPTTTLTRISNSTMGLRQ